MESTVLVTLTLGIALQLLAARTLTGGEYATFVLSLAVGNIANGIASAIQPVVALRASGDSTLAVRDLRRAIALALGVSVIAVVALSRSVGTGLAVAIGAQLPLHALVGVGQGRIQGALRLGPLAVSISMFAVLRMLVVVPLILMGVRNVHPFVLSLPLSLAGTLTFLALIGAFDGLTRGGRGTAGRDLLGPVLAWLVFYWLLNGDAVYGRMVLNASDAGQYAVSFTLGRLPVFLAAPLAIVLLPVMTRADTDRRRALIELLAVAAVLALGTALALGIVPALPVTLLAGRSDAASDLLVRLQAWSGASAALALLLFTFLFAMRYMPASMVSLFIAATIVVGGTALAGSAVVLALVQAITMSVIVALLAATAWSWTRSPAVADEA
ncbi:MAG: hypothetical protein EPO16_12000 [Dehalococcoidia bacterium]|nr:MAG: hypothetical protein EPO16_12000 [Dehalococcoidia bacterium]